MWCVIGTGAILLLVVLTLVGSTPDQLPGAISSRTAFSNVIIGGSVGGTLTGLYAARNRRQQRVLRQQADRLEALNRLLRDEVLNAVAVIRGYTETDGIEESEAIEAIDAESMAIERTVEEVKHLTCGPGSDRGDPGRVDLRTRLASSIESVAEAYPAAEISLQSDVPEVDVRADGRLEDVFVHLLENAVEYATTDPPSVAVSVTATRTEARISVRDEGPGLPDSQERLLETGEISPYDDPGSGFGLNLVRLLVEGYGGSIETDVGADGTTITVALTRADAEEFGVSESSLAGVRPNAPRLVVVLGAALLAGIPYGIVSEQLGGSVAGIGVFYGVSDPVVGWITHEFHSLVFGFVFAGLVSLAPTRYRESPLAVVAIGLAWGVVLWTVAAGFVAPIWLALLGFDVSIPTFTAYLLLSHLAWGLTLAVLTVAGYRYVTPGRSGVSERLRDVDQTPEVE